MQGCGRGGANKGQAGDLGDACLAGPRRRSRRFPLSARGMREEEGDPDLRARGRSETGQAGEAVRPLRPGGAEGERACAGWAVRSWAKPEVVGRARKWSRGTGLGPREEEEGREVGRGEAGSGWEIGFGFALGFSFSISISILFLTQAQLFEFKRNFEFKPL